MIDTKQVDLADMETVAEDMTQLETAEQVEEMVLAPTPEIDEPSTALDTVEKKNSESQAVEEAIDKPQSKAIPTEEPEAETPTSAGSGSIAQSVVIQQAAPSTTVMMSQNNQKSMGLALILTFFFGPLGMFYSTITGAIVMFLLTLVVGFFTVGIGLLFIWPVYLIWTVMAVSSHNKQSNFVIAQA